MVLWALGAVINVIGSVLINLGTNIIKLGHTKTAAAGDGPPPKFSRQPRKWWRFPGNKVWLAGMLSFTIGNLLNFASFAFAAQSLLSALGVVQFISNIIFGRFVNKEKVTKRVLGATAVVCTGCVLLVAFGNHESPTLSTHDMLELYSEPLYITYLCLIFTVSPTMYFVYRTGKRAVLADFTGAAAKKWSRWLPISYALFAGLLGTQGVLYGKTISMLLRTTFSGDSQLDNWYTWLSLLLFILFAGFWMSRYSKAMKLFPVLIIMPIIQIVWVLFSMVSGSIYFQEYKTLNALSGSMFGVGVVVLLVGVWLLTGGKASSQPLPPREPKAELSEEDKARVEEMDEEAVRTKSPLADNLEVVSPALLEPDEAVMARRLSNAYHSFTTAGASSKGPAGGIPLGGRSASVTTATGRGASISMRHGAAGSRPGSGVGKRGPEPVGEGSVSGESQAHLVEEGLYDSAVVEGSVWSAGSIADVSSRPSRPLSAVAARPSDTVTVGDADALAAAASPTTSLMHDLRVDWGIGVRDCMAAMRASIGLCHDDEETTAFSVWSMPMPSSVSISAANRRRSLDALHVGVLRGPGSRTTAATTDDLHSSGSKTRPGHRRLNRSRSANELDDILRAAQLEQVELAERGLSGAGGTPSRSNGSFWPSPSSASVPVLSTVHSGVAADSGLAASTGVARVSPFVAAAAPAATPMPASPPAAQQWGSSVSTQRHRDRGSEGRRQQDSAGVVGGSPALSGGSLVDESEAPGSGSYPRREGMLPSSEFLVGMSTRSQQELAAWEDAARQQNKP